MEKDYKKPYFYMVLCKFVDHCDKVKTWDYKLVIWFETLVIQGASCLMVTLVSGWEPWYFSKEIRDMENIFGYMC